MTVSKVGIGTLAVVTAALLELTLLARLPAFGGGRPALVLVLVVACALSDGPAAGALVGFGGGLLLDLLGDHPVGLLAFTFCLVGYLAGLFAGQEERSTLVPLLVAGLASVGAVVCYGVLAAVSGQVPVSAGGIVRGLPTTVLYDVALAAFVVPAVAALSRRLTPGGQLH